MKCLCNSVGSLSLCRFLGLLVTLKSTQHKIPIQINFQPLAIAFFWVDTFLLLKKTQIFTIVIYLRDFLFSTR